MISVSPTVQNIFKQQSSVRMGIGCDIEYNMNSLIDGLTITSATSDATYVAGIPGWDSNKANPYKKLFPVDSIIKSFRPSGSGIKYFILLPADTTTNSFSGYRTVQYPNGQPRVYYPGVNTAYKYWLSAKNANVDLTLTYKQSSSPYTGNKNALTNKIVIKFEKYHVLPTNYTVTITKSDNSTTTIGPSSPASDGVINLYYTGSAWTTTDNSETVGSVTPIAIKSIRLQATNPGGNKVVGVIEISARWVKDISSDVETISIQKEASSSSEDIIPVGKVTANSVNLAISKYDDNQLRTVSYNREITSFDSSITYIAKNVEIKPYYKVYHSAGQFGSSPNQYDKIKQGSYYANEWNISEYGEGTINGLDSAKYLMDTFCPDILCEGYPTTAILRRLLDSIGFTSYNFNLANTETSIPLLNYWWTEDTKTVWEAIQEICMDTQMNAVFDENNILQFYSRDYMYNASRSADWNFYQEKEGSTLPNIINFEQKEVPGGNYVKIIWNTPITSNYTGSSEELWSSPIQVLSAGGLKESISSNATELIIDTKYFGQEYTDQSFYSHQGYVLIDSEIIEYDAIGYDCVLLNGTKEHNWLTSQTDVNKYRYLCKAGYQDVNNPDTAYFKPSGRYRIKTRGALGTTAAAHSTGVDKVSSWTGRRIIWG